MVTIVEMFTHILEKIHCIAAIVLMLQNRGKTITLLIIVLWFFGQWLTCEVLGKAKHSGHAVQREPMW